MFIFGAGAVGKMTVGQALTKVTDLRLYHNHMDIEPVLQIFGTFHMTAIDRIRKVIFEEFANSSNYGLIFTFMWPLDSKESWDYIDNLAGIFRQKDADIYYVELFAPQEIRLQRNATENRLANKASKRNLEFSTSLILNEDSNLRLVSHDGEIPFENYIKIDNSNLSPEAVAEMIKEKFSL